MPSSTLAQTDRPTQKRADARANRHRLLEATGELVSSGRDFTLADVATEAGLATATAYRHFRSADDAINAFVTGFWDDFDVRVAALDPQDGITEFCRIWVDEVLTWGRALVQIRSREGFLDRRARDDARVERLLRTLEPCMAAEVASLRPDAGSEVLGYALSVWNALADPREVLDLHQAGGRDAKRIAGDLVHLTRAAIVR